MEKNTICQDQKKASPERTVTVTEIGKEENKKQEQEQKTTRHGKITVTALIEDKARVTTLPPSTARPHHCDVWSGADEGTAEARLANCEMNPGIHSKFMTIQEFRQQGLPNFFKSEADISYARGVINRTVRIKISCTSENRPDTYPDTDFPYPLHEYRGDYSSLRYGTGFLWTCGKWVGEECPCLDCKKSSRCKTQDEPKFAAYFQIFTATHVVFDSVEAQNAVFEFFYDDEERKEVECVYGVGVINKDPDMMVARNFLEEDKCFVIAVTHDIRVAEKLNKFVSGEDLHSQLSMSWEQQDCSSVLEFLVSHPHGASKRISFGDFNSFNKRVFVNQCRSPITLKKGLKVRFTGSPDNNDDTISIIKRLNLKPGLSYVLRKIFSRIIPSIGRNKFTDRTFTMLSDITVRSPSPIALHSTTSTSRGALDQWWTLPSGLKLVTSRGNDVFTLPRHHPNSNNLGEESIKLEIYVEGSVLATRFLCYHDDDDNKKVTASRTASSEWMWYSRYAHNMAACLGSSGAMIGYRGWYSLQKCCCCSNVYDDILPHFGLDGVSNKNASGIRVRGVSQTK